jgi:mRNA-degrading endonuclease RelE of RelBE toxin-antitoxin system
MGWTVTFTKKADKQLKKLPEQIQFAVSALIEDLKVRGPTQPAWPNFSKFRGTSGKYHCHIKKGRPTYVACWQESEIEIKVLEVYYVGTHEGAPY